MQPSVSVVIPCFNAARYLGEALDSVLQQSVKPAEIIVVDDGSTDNSEAIVATHHGVKYLRLEHSGQSVARNWGVENSHGSLLAFLDADDIWELDKLESQLNAMSLDHDLDIVMGLVGEFYSPEIPPEKRTAKLLQNAAGYVPETLLIKRDSFLRVGAFATNWKIGEFVDWCLRARDLQLKSQVLPKSVLRRRVHDHNLGIRERASLSDYASIVKSSLDRRRRLVHS